MNIVIVANDNYTIHAGVMLTSLFEHNRQHHFHVFLLTDGISAENESRLRLLCENYGNYITVHQPEKELAVQKGLDIKRLNSGKWNSMIYYKLFMPSILPEEVERCLFLDVDMVVVDDVRELYHTKFSNGDIIAAVEDLVSCMPRKKVLGLDEDSLYINSGVMLCDIARWRILERERPIFDFTLSVADRIINEQDVIALYMRNRLRALPLRWNMVGCNYLRQRFVFPKYYEELHYARKYPAIHHFCTLIQPWYADSPHPYRNLYRKYLKIYGRIANFSPDLHFPYRNCKKNIVGNIRHHIGRILNLLDIIKQPGYVLHKLRY